LADALRFCDDVPTAAEDADDVTDALSRDDWRVLVTLDDERVTTAEMSTKTHLSLLSTYT